MVKKVFLFAVLVILVVAYTMLVGSPTYDEIWNYGYGYNIASGMIPYRDFNMLATPLWLYLVALSIKILGNYLLSMHILNAIVIVGMFFLIHNMLGKKSLIIFPLILIGSTPTYNVFSTFLFILFIYLKSTDFSCKKSSIIFGLIVSMLFLTKQTLGMMLFIVEFFYTRNKKIYFASFMLPILLFCFYFVMNGAFYQFIDYSFLGMLDFGSRNSNVSIYLFLEIFICIFVIYLYKRYKYPELLYVLSFQIVVVPIFDIYHFALGVRMIVLVLLLKFDYMGFKTKYFVIWTLMLLILDSIVGLQDGVSMKNNYLFGRNIGNNAIVVIDETSNYINDYDNDYDKIYIVSGMAYMIRLYMDDSIDRYDMILNGNMGYKGYLDYIEGIDDYCNSNRCLFLVESYLGVGYDQTNHEIIDYVYNNYYKVDEFYIFDVYSN